MKPMVDRVEFRPEQRLSGADLTQACTRAFDLLALHAARGHDVWGVVSGYTCRLTDDQTSFIVDPGVALDRCGRPLLNSQKRVFPLPSVPRDGSAYVYDLVADWAPTPELPQSCSQRRLPVEQARFRWEWAGTAPADPLDAPPPYSRRVRLGADVPIARLTTGTAKAVAKVDIRSRPVAHALVRPKIATGRVLQSTVEVQGSYADWRLKVPTASAGFDPNRSPVYLVTVDAHPFGESASAGTDTGAAARPGLNTRMQNWAGPFVSIESKQHDWFVVRVVTASGPGWAYNTEPKTNPVPLSWKGIDTPDPGPFVWWWWYALGLRSVVIQ